MARTKKYDKLIKDISHPDVSRRRQAATALGETDERALYPLIKLLSDENSAVIDAAMQSILAIGGEAASYMLLPVLRKGAVQRNVALLILKDIGASTVPLLYDLLYDKDDDIRKFALDLLGDIAVGAEIDKILPALKDPNPNVRAAACRTLGLLKAEGAISYIEEALKDEEWVAFSALEALGEIGSAGAVAAIDNVCKIGTSVLQFSALETLGKIHSEDSKKVLIGCLQDTLHRSKDSDYSGMVKKAALKSLVTLGIDPDMEYLGPQLMELFKSGDWEEKMTAVEGLRMVREKRAVEGLLDAAGSIDTSNMDDAEYYEKIKAVVTEIADCDGLLKILGEGRLKSRGEALLVELLGTLHCREAAARLIELLRGSYRDIRRGAAKALVEIADESAVDTLIEALKDDDCHVKKQVVYALRKLGNKKAFYPLLELLDSEKCEDVIDESVKALIGMDSSKFLNGLDFYPKKLKRYIARYASNEEVLLKIALSEDEDLRIAAMKRLSSLHPDENISRMVAARMETALSDPNPEVRKTAILGLAQRGEVSEAMLQALHDMDIWVRIHTIKALAALGGYKYIDQLYTMLKDEEILVVMVTIDAIAELKGMKSHDMITELRSHADETIRARIEETIHSL
ncbi:HEAT repeat domain-containing protein [Candidatus Magnetominusculus xianensis]|uniref:Oxidoreductase/HEAT repeat-containing protein n=1 Tax=Candidatus Magnetominusculus xianensis TaxID=1748249 RepID=A0ABR5SE60_9BACT|nr:HEAT repeat domain-containing protein [Candidatus Magnetominusculus xianensis]KWT84082.1 putative oxidoreductase/HEAT repeat-containing protein [Candidatus Magnetominusculus xianensis]MBF0402375.1 HEAT repeat domain-containing protein [Nitrospirota bacterium]